MVNNPLIRPNSWGGGIGGVPLDSHEKRSWPVGHLGFVFCGFDSTHGMKTGGWKMKLSYWVPGAFAVKLRAGYMGNIFP